MALFTGQSEHKLDVKGRLFLPRRILDAVDEPAERSAFTATIGPEPCLYLFTRSGFARHLTAVQERMRGTPEYPTVMRGLSQLTFDQEVDGQGRLLLPDTLRRAKGLDKDVVVVGVFDHFEIWDAARWRDLGAPAAERAYLEQASGFFLGGFPSRGVES